MDTKCPIDGCGRYINIRVIDAHLREHELADEIERIDETRGLQVEAPEPNL